MVKTGNICSKCKKGYPNGQLQAEYDLTDHNDLFCDYCYVPFLIRLKGMSSTNDDIKATCISKLTRLKWYITNNYETTYIKEMEKLFGTVWNNLDTTEFQIERERKGTIY